MGIFDKMLSAMKIEDDEDEEYEDDYEVADTDPSKKEKRGLFFRRNHEEDDEEEEEDLEPRKKERAAKVADFKRRNPSSGSMEVCVIKPASFDSDVKEIAETLLAGRTVILNMEGLDLSVGQRIIDFMCGATYSVDGNLQKISSFIFIITPKNVDLSGDLQGIVDSFEFSGLNMSR